MRLRAALLDPVPRVDYERVNEELESMTKRLAEAISAQRAAMAIAEEEPLEAASPCKDEVRILHARWTPFYHAHRRRARSLGCSSTRRR